MQSGQKAVDFLGGGEGGGADPHGACFLGTHRAVGFSGAVESGAHGVVGGGVSNVEGEQRHMGLAVGARCVEFTLGHPGNCVVSRGNELHFVLFDPLARFGLNEAQSHIERGNGGNIQCAALEAVGQEVGLGVHAGQTACAALDDCGKRDAAVDDQQSQTGRAV